MEKFTTALYCMNFNRVNKTKVTQPLDYKVEEAAIYHNVK